jgi:hypothetical protein
MLHARRPERPTWLREFSIVSLAAPWHERCSIAHRACTRHEVVHMAQSTAEHDGGEFQSTNLVREHHRPRTLHQSRSDSGTGMTQDVRL